MTDTYVPDAYFELVSEARFGDDPGTSRWQGLYGEAYRSQLPMDPERERDPQWWAEEWVDVWRNNPDAVRPWFTRGHRGLASAVSSATGIPITVQPWNELAWLADRLRSSGRLASRHAASSGRVVTTRRRNPLLEA